MEDSPLTSDMSEDEDNKPEDSTSIDLNQLFSTPAKQPVDNPTPTESISEEDILSNLINYGRTTKQRESSHTTHNSRWRRSARRRKD